MSPAAPALGSAARGTRTGHAGGSSMAGRRPSDALRGRRPSAASYRRSEVPAFWQVWARPRAEEDLCEAAATQIQAVWRGSFLRQTLPAIVGYCYSQALVANCWVDLGPRRQAKAFIRARNRRISVLREEIARYSGFFSHFNRQQLLKEIGSHLENKKHRLRATLILQAWWRGCTQRAALRPRRARPLSSAFAAPREDSTSEEERGDEGQGNFLSFFPSSSLAPPFFGGSSSSTAPPPVGVPQDRAACTEVSPEALEAASEAWLGDVHRFFGDEWRPGGVFEAINSSRS